MVGALEIYVMTHQTLNIPKTVKKKGEVILDMMRYLEQRICGYKRNVK